jgi:hypothetical protein
MECPDYVKKFDNPNTQHHLRRQIYNLLILPYMNTRLQKAHDNLPKDIRDKDSFMPYPEELKTRVEPFDNDVLRKYSEVVKDKADI